MAPVPGNVVAFIGDAGRAHPALVLGVLRVATLEPDLDLVVVLSHDRLVGLDRAATCEIAHVRFGPAAGGWQYPVDAGLMLRPAVDPAVGPESVVERYRMPTGWSAADFVRPVPAPAPAPGFLGRIVNALRW